MVSLQRQPLHERDPNHLMEEKRPL
jgi:hypothetical protein